MQGTLTFLRAVARAVVLGLPVAVSARDVLGTPAVVDGFSMQVSTISPLPWTTRLDIVMRAMMGALGDKSTQCGSFQCVHSSSRTTMGRRVREGVAEHELM